MSLQKIDLDQVQTAVQHLVDVLASDNVSIPGTSLEGVVSGKSLLRAILSGQLFVCTDQPAEKSKDIKKSVDDGLPNDQTHDVGAEEEKVA